MKKYRIVQRGCPPWHFYYAQVKILGIFWIDFKDHPFYDNFMIFDSYHMDFSKVEKWLDNFINDKRYSEKQKVIKTYEIK
jgi:hypothetical protein